MEETILYDVFFSISGFAQVRAKSEEEARAIAYAMSENDISWSDTIDISDIQETETRHDDHASHASDARTEKRKDKKMKKKHTFDITFSRFGFVRVEADSEAEAWQMAENMSENDISWSDDIETTDVQETDEYGTFEDYQE